jgi:hypothetical protein
MTSDVSAVSAVSAVTSLLLEEGWHQVDEGPRGMLWAKGEALSPIPYGLRLGSRAWRSLLTAIADVEGERVEDIAIRIDRFLRSMPDAPKQADRNQLDLHLDGPGVRNDHETSAYHYGRFVATLAETVKELVKDTSGVWRHKRDLQIVGGADAGSVTILIREPSGDVGKGPDPLPDLPKFEPPERTAMLMLSQILNAAEEAASTPGKSTLDAQLHLGPTARRSIARLAGIMYNAGWITSGYLVGGSGQSPLPIALSLAGSLRLQRSATDDKDRVISETHHGVLDGWLWSTATMQLITDQGRTLRAAVPMVLQSQVADLISTPDQRVTATFQVFERLAPTGDAQTRTYALSVLEPDPPLPVERDDS